MCKRDVIKVEGGRRGGGGGNVLISSLKGNNVAEIRGGGRVISGVVFIERRFGDTCVL